MCENGTGGHDEANIRKESTMTIRYLAIEEAWKSRLLWNEMFPEESKEFCDYYFTEKIKHNKILVLEEDGEIISMVHQNPYQLSIKGHIHWIDFFVGGATRESMQGKGYFKKLFQYAFQRMWEEDVPFTFLTPTIPSLYRFWGYDYIYNQPQWSLRDEYLESGSEPLQIRILRQEELKEVMPQILCFCKKWFKARYEVYALRDEVYVHQLIKELHSEAGQFQMLYHRKELVGIRGIWGAELQEQRFLLCEADYIKTEAVEKPAIMARIISIQEFVKLIHLHKDMQEEQKTLIIKLEDSMVEQNNQVFSWHLRRETSWLEPWEGTETDCMLHVSMGEFTQWLFGYQVPKSVEDYQHMIQPLQGVFLDEVV